MKAPVTHSKHKVKIFKKKESKDSRRNVKTQLSKLNGNKNQKKHNAQVQSKERRKKKLSLINFESSSIKNQKDVDEGKSLKEEKEDISEEIEEEINEVEIGLKETEHKTDQNSPQNQHKHKIQLNKYSKEIMHNESNGSEAQKPKVNYNIKSYINSFIAKPSP